MLGNLIDNAIRYTPPGGYVDVALRLDEGSAVIEISDTGPGVPEEDRQRVFDRFYRREASHTSGSGLGLAIVKNIAERHHAEVLLQNREPGPGLRVRLAFPLG
jgi:two-component system OmpR family sensor kinase